MQDRTKKREQLMAQTNLALLKEAQEWKDAFGTEDGKKCLALLEKHYYDIDMIASSDPTVTQNRAAQRDLVRYVKSQIEFTGE